MSVAEAADGLKRATGETMGADAAETRSLLMPSDGSGGSTRHGVLSSAHESMPQVTGVTRIARKRIDPAVAAKWNGRIEALRRDLCVEQSPTAFLARLDADMGEGPDTIPGYVLFNLPTAVTMRDAWIIGRYAVLTDADRVRLGDDRWPDGIMRYGSRIVSVEATEAWEPGRRRGDEYMASHHDASLRVRRDPVENWVRRADAIGPSVREAIARKNARHYAGEAELVVYVGFSEFGIRGKQLVREIRRAVADHGSRFTAVRVIWNGRLY